MKQRGQRNRAFSLIEVTTTLGVIAFALVGLIGVLPMALQYTRTSVDETRAAQLARAVFATIHSEPFNEVRCYGNGEPLIDLATFGEAESPVFLWVTYDPRDRPRIARASSAPPNTEYRVELRFEPESLLDSMGAHADQRGNTVTLRIYSQPPNERLLFEGAQFVSRIKRTQEVARLGGASPPTP